MEGGWKKSWSIAGNTVGKTPELNSGWEGDAILGKVSRSGT